MIIKNTICVLIILFFSLCASLTIIKQTQDLSCSDISTLLNHLGKIQKDIDNLRKSFLERVELLASNNTENDLKIVEMKQTLMKIVEEDIRRIKILKEIFTDIEISLKEVKSSQCKEKAQEAVNNVKKSITSFIQLMQTKAKKFDDKGELSKSIALIELF